MKMGKRYHPFDKIQGGIVAASDADGIVYVKTDAYYEHIGLMNHVQVLGAVTEIAYIDSANEGAVLQAIDVSYALMTGGIKCLSR